MKTKTKDKDSAYSNQVKGSAKCVLNFMFCLMSMLIHVCNSCYAMMGTWLQGGVSAKVPALLTEGSGQAY